MDKTQLTRVFEGDLDGFSTENRSRNISFESALRLSNDNYTDTPIIISCEKCNSAVLLDTPDDIAYLYRLAQENPLLYAELACKPNGLHEYVDAINEIN